MDEVSNSVVPDAKFSSGSVVEKVKGLKHLSC
jgi:hypothetical protein